MDSPFGQGGPPAGAWPAQAVLLAPVAIPFQGTYEGVSVWYDVDACKQVTADYEVLRADLVAEEKALLLSKASMEEKIAVDEDIYLTLCVRILLLCVDKLTVPWAGAAPPVHDPATWLGMHAVVLEWLAFEGRAQVEQEYGGPKVMRRALVPSR